MVAIKWAWLTNWPALKTQRQPQFLPQNNQLLELSYLCRVYANLFATLRWPFCCLNFNANLYMFVINTCMYVYKAVR